LQEEIKDVENPAQHIKFNAADAALELSRAITEDDFAKLVPPVDDGRDAEAKAAAAVVPKVGGGASLSPPPSGLNAPVGLKDREETQWNDITLEEGETVDLEADVTLLVWGCCSHLSLDKIFGKELAKQSAKIEQQRSVIERGVVEHEDREERLELKQAELAQSTEDQEELRLTVDTSIIRWLFDAITIDDPLKIVSYFKHNITYVGKTGYLEKLIANMEDLIKGKSNRCVARDGRTAPSSYVPVEFPHRTPPPPSGPRRRRRWSRTSITM